MMVRTQKRFLSDCRVGVQVRQCQQRPGRAGQQLGQVLQRTLPPFLQQIVYPFQHDVLHCRRCHASHQCGENRHVRWRQGIPIAQQHGRDAPSRRQDGCWAVFSQDHVWFDQIENVIPCCQRRAEVRSPGIAVAPKNFRVAGRMGLIRPRYVAGSVPAISGIAAPAWRAHRCHCRQRISI